MEPATPSHFGQGFINGAVNGALTLGVFTGLIGLLSVFGVIAPIAWGSALLTAGVGAIATGLVSGFRAAMHARQNPASQASRPAERDSSAIIGIPAVSRIQTPAIPTIPAADRADLAAHTDAITADTATPPNWQARTGRDANRPDSIRAILDNPRIDPKDRASAILREQQDSPSRGLDR